MPEPVDRTLGSRIKSSKFWGMPSQWQTLEPGAGSYEPRDRLVVAAEPSTTMIRQRPPGSAHVVQARAEALPFPSGSFDTVLAILTIHHWDSPILGLLEMRRVSRKRVVVLTWDQDVWESFWLIREYIPCIRDLDRRHAVDFSTIKRIYWGLVLSVPSRFLMTVATAFMGPFGDDQRLILMRKSGQEYRHVRFYLATSTSPDSIDWRRMLGAGSGKKSTMTCSPGYRLIVAEMS